MVNRLKAIVEGDDPVSTAGLILQLSHIRSAVIVGRALADKFPTEEAWITYCNSPQFIVLVEEFTGVITDLKTILPEMGDLLDPEQVQLAVEQHYDRALDAMWELSETLEIPAVDLLAFLVNS